MGDNRQSPALGGGLDESALLLQLQQGGDSAELACRHLHRRYASRFFKFFRRRGLRDEEAEDLVQETFFRVYRSSKTYERRAQAENWLFTIAQNVWKNDHRAKQAFKRQLDKADSLDELEERGSGALRLAAEDASPAEGALASERTRVLFEVAGRLPAKMCEVVQLSLLGRSQGEIAQVLQISVSTVKWQLREARQRMRDPLARRGLTWP